MPSDRIKPRGLLGRITRRPNAITSVIKIANALLGFLTAVLLARTLGVEGYGEYAFVYAIMTMLAIPTTLGLPQLVIRETALALQAGNTARIRAIWSWAHRVILVTSFAIAIMTIAAVPIFGTGISSPNTFLLGLLLVPLIALGNLRGASLRGLGRLVFGQLPDSILRPLFFNIAVLLWIVIAGTTNFTAFDALLLHIAAAFATFIIGTAILLRHTPPMEAGRTEAIDGRALLLATGALGAVAGLTTINNNIDIIMIARALSATEVGIYKPVVTIAGLALFGQQVVTVVIMPQVAKLYAAGKTAELQQLLKRNARRSFLLALGVLTAIVLGGQWGLGVAFGEPFRAGYPALVILACAQTINAALGSTALLMNMSGNERITLAAISAAVAANLILNSVLIRFMGIEGAATATFAALMLYKGILTVVIRRRLGIGSSIF